MGGRSESDYREVVFEREGKGPLHGFVRVDRGMVIVRGYGGHKEARVGSSARVDRPIVAFGAGESRAPLGSPLNGLCSAGCHIAG